MDKSKGGLVLDINIYNVSKGPSQRKGFCAYCNLIVCENEPDIEISANTTNSVFTSWSCKSLVLSLDRISKQSEKIDSITIYSDDQYVFNIFNSELGAEVAVKYFFDYRLKLAVNSVINACRKFKSKHFNTVFHFKRIDDSMQNNEKVKYCQDKCQQLLEMCSELYAKEQAEAKKQAERKQQQNNKQGNKQHNHKHNNNKQHNKQNNNKQHNKQNNNKQNNKKKKTEKCFSSYNGK